MKGTLMHLQIMRCANKHYSYVSNLRVWISAVQAGLRN